MLEEATPRNHFKKYRGECIGLDERDDKDGALVDVLNDEIWKGCSCWRRSKKFQKRQLEAGRQLTDFKLVERCKCQYDPWLYKIDRVFITS